MAVKGKLQRGAIVALYTLVFWGLLPAALWWAGTSLDARMQWPRAPSPWGWPVVAAGTALLTWGIAALWTEGRGLPVSALPPPRFAKRGPYALVRHPIYLGFQVALLGAAWVSGSCGLGLVALAFAPLWVSYALVEERGLIRRFGASYRTYRQLVGLFGVPELYRLPQLLLHFRAVPWQVEGREHVPVSGGVVLVANHACYLDPAFVGLVTGRCVRYPTTAEAFRQGLTRRLVRRFVSVAVRRYRVDPVACRQIMRLLAAGEVVGIFVERERNPLGTFGGSAPEVARQLSRLPYPVIPVGVSGAYDVGPRWASVLRRRPVHVRAGPPIGFGGDPKVAVDQAIAELILVDPQPVHLDGIDRARLAQVIWRCPRCLSEDGWSAQTLTCVCGATWTPTSDGRFEGGDGAITLAALAQSVWQADELDTLTQLVSCWAEISMYGPIEPLEHVGDGELLVSQEGLRCLNRRWPLDQIRSTSTERNDTLQIATDEGMWQFRMRSCSPFRLQRALDRWREQRQLDGRR